MGMREGDNPAMKVNLKWQGKKWHTEQENRYKKTLSKERTNKIQIENKQVEEKQLVTTIYLCYHWNSTLKQAQEYFTLAKNITQF